VSIAGSQPSDAAFYDLAPVEPNLIYQGEILIETPLLLVQKEKRWLLLRTRSGRTIHEALKGGSLSGPVNVLDSNQTEIEWRNAVDGDSAVGYLTKRPVLVLSQNCDIENKDFIQVAPIYPADDLEAVKQLKSGNELYSAFFLEAHLPHFPDSFADLERIQAVHKSYIKRPDADKHFRLSPTQIRLLQRHITRYFGRPNSYDARVDKAPSTDTYLCADCFYLSGVATAIDLRAGEAIRPCEICAGVTWVRKS